MLPFTRYVTVLAVIVAVTFAQDYDYEEPRAAPQRVRPGYSGPSQNNAPRPTPVAILKQINRHNEDGSYTYGYESADGSFKIETKLPTGEVKGKYGYVDDTGKVRTIEYGATKHGFAPSGEGITVPPPTLVDETTNRDGLPNQDYQNNYYQPQEQQQPIRAAPRPRPRPQPVYEQFEAPQFAPAPQRNAAPVPPRAQIPGAVQTTTLDFGPPQRPANVRSFQPAPAPRPQSAPNQFSFPDFDTNPPVRAAPKVTYAQPAPLPSQYVPESRPPPRYRPGPPPAPVAAPSRPVPSVGGRSSGGILDQLSRDYALPEGGAAPLHDISFGYY
ncbi:cyclin-K [Coccinella septempunctata]|uniref:cyclin-K n=1 Tax=Coccinella septempunctata TaxID=41139 RepID=UPI001D05D58E|nr:cyclin-K [Coccinella septempunctata]